MNNLIDELRDLYFEYEFNEFLKSIQYDKNKVYDELNYEYFTIQWMSIWIKDIDYLMKNKDNLKFIFTKILRCQKTEVRIYLIIDMINDIIENNNEYKITYQNILHQKYKLFFDIYKDNNLKNNNDITNIIDNKEKLIEPNKNDDKNDKTIINIDEIMDKIDIHKIYKIEDINKDKKRKFGNIEDYFDDNNNNNNRKKVKKNITIEIDKGDIKNNKKSENKYKDNKKNENIQNLNIINDAKKNLLGILKDKIDKGNNNKILSNKNKELLEKINQKFNLLKKNKK